MVLDRQKVWTDRWTHGRRQNYIPPTSSGDKKYRSVRPVKMMDPDSPFFLLINYARKSGKAWYKRTPMGINKLYSIMNDMKAGASLQTSDKRLTPYYR